MKKIFTYLILLFGFLSFYSCSFNNCGCDTAPYVLRFNIDIKNIEPSVSVIKVSIKNIDRLEPEAYAYDDNYTVKKEDYIFTRKKEKEDGDDEKNFPGKKHFPLTYPLLDVDRVFELKIYKDNVLFLTKKLTFRTTEGSDGRKKTIKAEVDNMDYVDLIKKMDDGETIFITI